MSRFKRQQQARERDVAQGFVTRVLRLRLKDKHAAYLRGLAAQVNLVWNFDNEVSLKAFERERRFLTAVDLHELTRGATKEGLSLHSQTVQAVNEEFVLRRKQFKKVKLRWRVANSSATCWNTAEPTRKPSLLAPLRYLCKSKPLRKRPSRASTLALSSLQ